jgi:hypothetical protein
VDYFKVLSWHSPEGTQESYKKSQDSESFGRDSNRTLPENMSESLLLEPVQSLKYRTCVSFSLFVLHAAHTSIESISSPEMLQAMNVLDM